jgi:hypothetical protein
VVDYIGQHAYLAAQLPSVRHDPGQFFENSTRHHGNSIAAAQLRQQWRQQFAQSDCDTDRSRDIVRDAYKVSPVELTALERALLGAIVA